MEMSRASSVVRIAWLIAGFRFGPGDRWPIDGPADAWPRRESPRCRVICVNARRIAVPPHFSERSEAAVAMGPRMIVTL